MRGDTAQGGSAGPGTSVGTLAGTSPGGGWRIGADEAAAGHLIPVAFGGNNTAGPISVATALNAHGGPVGRLDFESETFIAQAVTGDITHALNTANNGKHCGEDGTGRGAPIVATALRSRDGAKGVDSDCTDTLIPVACRDRHEVNVAVGMAVRRLTPCECLRLQSFPDDYLDAVTHRGKPLADGPMYKMIGNSWNTDTVRWIFRRIDAQWRGGP